MDDETLIPVLSEDKPGAIHRGYHWIYYDPVNKLVCFDYRKSRGREGSKSFLKDFTGYLQSDGYKAYADLGLCSDDDASLLSGRPVAYFLC